MVVMVAGAGAASGTKEGIETGAFLGFSLLLAYFVWASLLFASGTTPGKKLLGMRVIKEDGSPAGWFTMFFREVIGKAISLSIFSIGFLWILLDPERQGWHDKLASTYVIQ